MASWGLLGWAHPRGRGFGLWILPRPQGGVPLRPALPARSAGVSLVSLLIEEAVRFLFWQREAAGFCELGVEVRVGRLSSLQGALCPCMHCALVCH